MFVTQTADCIEASEAQGQRALSAWLEAAGMGGVDWPLSTDDAARLLGNGGQYAVDADKLRELGRRGQVPAVELWDAKDILAAGAALEGRRDWWPGACVHSPKKHASRVALENLLIEDPENGFNRAVAIVGGMDLELALILLTEADNREMREKLLTNVTILLAAHEANRTKSSE